MNTIHVFEVFYSYASHKEGYRRNGSAVVLTSTVSRAVRLVEEQFEDVAIWQVSHKGIRSQVIVDSELES